MSHSRPHCRQRPCARTGRSCLPSSLPVYNAWHVPRPQWHRNAQSAQCAAIEQDVEPIHHPVSTFHIDPQDTDLHVEEEISTRKLINRQLKQTASLLQLRMLLESEHGAFDSVNTSFALSLVAKMSRSVLEQFKRAGLLSPEARARHYTEHVAPCLAVLQPLVFEHITQFEAWDTALSLWAFANLDYYDRQLFEILCSRALQLRDELKPIDCANIMIAFGRWGHYHPELLRSLPQVLLDHMYDTKPGEVMQVLWGFAKLRVAQAPGRPFLEAICEYVASSMHVFSSTELSCVVWALAKLRFYPGLLFLQHTEAIMLKRLRTACASSRQPKPSMLSPVHPYYDTHDADGHQRYGTQASPTDHGWGYVNGAQQQSPSARHGLARTEVGDSGRESDLFTPWPAPDPRVMNHQDIASLLWAFGQLRYKAALLLDELPLCLGAWLPQFSNSSACALLTSYAHARHYHHGVMEAMASWLTPRLHVLSLGELTIVLWTYGIFHHSPAAEPRLLATLSSHIHAHMLAHGGPSARPQVLALIAKSCANLQFRPEPLLQEVVHASLARLEEFTPDEMAHLLYGLSYLGSRAPACDLPAPATNSAAARAGQSHPAHMPDHHALGPGSADQQADGVSVDVCRRIVQQEEMQLFYAVVRQCMRLLDEPGHPYGSRHFLHHKVLNSIVHSCVRIGYTPWSLVDFAESKGMRLVQLNVAAGREQSAGRSGRPATAGACGDDVPPRALVSTPGRALSGQHTRPPPDVDMPPLSRADQHLRLQPFPAELRVSRGPSRRQLFSAHASVPVSSGHSQEPASADPDTPFSPAPGTPERPPQVALQHLTFVDRRAGLQGDGVHREAQVGLLRTAHGESRVAGSHDGASAEHGVLRLLEKPTRISPMQSV